MARTCDRVGGLSAEHTYKPDFLDQLFLETIKTFHKRRRTSVASKTSSLYAIRRQAMINGVSDTGAPICEAARRAVPRGGTPLRIQCHR